MKRVLFYCLLALALVGAVKGQESPGQQKSGDEELKKEVLKLEHEKLKAAFEGITALADWHERYDADSIAITDANGSTSDKSQRVAEYRTGELHVLFQDHYDYQVHVYNGNTAVVSYLEHGINERKGSGRRNVHAAATDVFIKQDEAWRIIAHQITPIPTE